MALTTKLIDALSAIRTEAEESRCANTQADHSPHSCLRCAVFQLADEALSVTESELASGTHLVFPEKCPQCGYGEILKLADGSWTCRVGGCEMTGCPTVQSDEIRIRILKDRIAELEAQLAARTTERSE